MTHILLIEDNPIDARLIQRMLGKSNELPSHVTWIDDGQKALWFLRSLESGGVAEPPALILLDLNLPKYDGVTVLEAFRASAAAWALPIFLLSSASAESIEAEAANRNLKADGYFQKPNTLPEFEALMRRIQQLAMPSFSASRTAVGLEQTIPALL